MQIWIWKQIFDRRECWIIKNVWFFCDFRRYIPTRTYVCNSVQLCTITISFVYYRVETKWLWATSSRAPLFWAPLTSALPKSERSMSATHFKIEECRLSDTHFWEWVKSKSALFKKASEFIEFEPISFFFALRAKWYIIDFL